MSTSRAAGVTSRGAAYGLLGLVFVVPLVVFVVVGVDAGQFQLTGFGGPMVAFSAGALSFLSPCVLPLVPVFITNLAGASVEDGQSTASRSITVRHAVAFTAGLSLVFVALGASAGLLGSFVLDHLRSVEQVAGLLLILLGALLLPGYERRSAYAMVGVLAILAGVLLLLAEVAALRDSPARLLILAGALFVVWARFAGFLRLNLFSRTLQFNLGGSHGPSYWRSALVGGAFATGWTPCVGPILGGILTLAAASGEVWTGVYLLLAYSAGFSVPFLITGLAVADVTRVLKKFQRHMSLLEVMSAVVMVGLGTLLLSGRLAALNEYFAFFEFNQGL
jgi:cytochrome c-type biogenesis protein